MGIVNVTPDSFSDGGAYRSAAEAADCCAGACWTTAPRSSTSAASRPRPGADTVSQDEELRRVLPVLESLPGRPLSVDTSRAEVARRAVAP